MSKTFTALCQETLRYLMPAQIDLSGTLVGTLTATAKSIPLSGFMVSQNSISPGMELSVGLEIMYVTGWTTSSNSGTVVRGFRGSVPATHAATSMVTINPKFSLFTVATAINEEIAALSGDAGLYAVKTITITYNPAFIGYNFAAPTGYIEVLGARYKIAPPTHNYPPLHISAVLPNMTDPTYPTHFAIIFYESAWPGLPIHVWCKCAFTTLTALTQTVTSISGVPVTALDIPPIGAAIRLVSGREIKRNFIESQPDPRKATEIPPGSIINSVKGLQMIYTRRVNDERGRLNRLYRTLAVRK